MNVTREQVVAEAKEWINTPYVAQQSIKGVAVDCVGFAAGIGRNTGATPDVDFETSYRGSSNGETMVSLFRQYMEPIDWRDAQLADFFIIRYSHTHWHCMMVSKREENIETEFTVIEAGREKVEEHRIDASTKRRIHSAYRIRGIKD